MYDCRRFPVQLGLAGHIVSGLILIALLLLAGSHQPVQSQADALFVDSGQALTAPVADGNASVAVALGDLDNDGDLDALVGHGFQRRC